MRIEAGKEEIIKYSYICDVCGKGSDHHRVCSICGRDICFNCTKFDPRDIGDYPSIYCDHCFQIGQKYLDRISTEEEKCDAIIEGLQQEWREQAIKVVEQGKDKSSK